jgi:hypothetical protein
MNTPPPGTRVRAIKQLRWSWFLAVREANEGSTGLVVNPSITTKVNEFVVEWDHLTFGNASIVTLDVVSPI